MRSFHRFLSSGTGIPLLPLCCKPTRAAHLPPTHISPRRSFLHFLSLQGFVQSGPHHRGLYTRHTAGSLSPRFPLIQACCFHFIWDAKSSLMEGGGLNSAVGKMTEVNAVLPWFSSGRQTQRRCFVYVQTTNQLEAAT